jgi:tetratricopeptide (TPR) repeat protein
MLYRVALLLVISVPAFSQQPSKTWAVVQPIVQAWDAEYNAAGRSIAARDKILVEIHDLLNQHLSDIWAYEAAALGYNHLNRNTEALEVLRAYLRRFPNDSTLEERVLSFFGNWGTAEDLESLPESWHDRTDYWQTLLHVYAGVKAPPGKLERAGDEVLKRIPPANDPGGDQRFTIAEMWLANGVDPRAAERVAREAVAISEVGQRPSWQYKNEQQFRFQNRLLIRNVNRSPLGWALYQEGRYRDALAELQHGVNIVEQDPFPVRGLYYRLGQTLEKLGRPDEAVEAYYKELAWGDLESPTKRALATVYNQLHGNSDGMEVAERTRVNELAMQRAQRGSDLVTSVDEDLGRFDLLDENNQPLDLKQYRGNLVIIEFWATWCESCMACMKQTDELQKKYGDKVVVIAPSTDPEETRTKAAPYLKRMNYRFILVFDDEKRRDIQLPYIPASLLLDQNGRLRFMALGFSSTGNALLEQRLVSLLGGSGT